MGPHGPPWVKQHQANNITKQRHGMVSWGSGCIASMACIGKGSRSGPSCALHLNHTATPSTAIPGPWALGFPQAAEAHASMGILGIPRPQGSLGPVIWQLQEALFIHSLHVRISLNPGTHAGCGEA